MSRLTLPFPRLFRPEGNPVPYRLDTPTMPIRSTILGDFTFVFDKVGDSAAEVKICVLDDEDERGGVREITTSAAWDDVAGVVTLAGRVLDPQANRVLILLNGGRVLLRQATHRERKVTPHPQAESQMNLPRKLLDFVSLEDDGRIRTALLALLSALGES